MSTPAPRDISERWDMEDAERILSEYVMADSTVDSGNLFFAANTFKSAYESALKRAEAAEQMLDKMNNQFAAMLIERDALRAALEKMKAKWIEEDCDCGYEGPDSDHGFLAPLCYRCEFLVSLEEALKGGGE